MFRDASIGPQVRNRVVSSPQKFLSIAKVVKAKSTGNAALAMPATMSDEFGKAVDQLDAAQTKAKSGSKQDLKDRDAKAVVVFQQLQQIAAFVQCVANQQPTAAEAEAVIVGAGFEVKRRARRRKADFAAKYTGISGEARLVARAVKGARAYYWEWSTDQQTWTVALETAAPETTLHGFTPGQLYHFRFRTLGPEGKSDPSPVVTLIAH
jgi:hypothetical protein